MDTTVNLGMGNGMGNGMGVRLPSLLHLQLDGVYEGDDRTPGLTGGRHLVGVAYLRLGGAGFATSPTAAEHLGSGTQRPLEAELGALAHKTVQHWVGDAVEAGEKQREVVVVENADDEVAVSFQQGAD